MISIVIPTYNEEKYLPKLLTSIENQTYKKYEIIVADNNSTDKTRKLAKKFGCKIVEGGLPGVGRNNGARKAKGQYLLFLDADVLIPRDFLELAFNEFQNRYLEIATCSIVPLSDKAIDKLLYFGYNQYVGAVQYFNPKAPGFCILCTKRLFDRVRGFNESMKLGEDHDFCERAGKIAKFRVLESTNVFISVRRFKKEGRLNLVKKYALNYLYSFITDDINVVDYNYGGYEDLPDKEKKLLLKKYIHMLKDQISVLEKEYAGLRIKLGKGKEKLKRELRQKQKSIQEKINTLSGKNSNN